ncbi:hypothetical protein ACJX0J_030818, partial [Zea mays]
MQSIDLFSNEHLKYYYHELSYLLIVFINYMILLIKYVTVDIDTFLHGQAAALYNTIAFLVQLDAFHLNTTEFPYYLLEIYCLVIARIPFDEEAQIDMAVKLAQQLGDGRIGRIMELHYLTLLYSVNATGLIQNSDYIYGVISEVVADIGIKH